MSDRPIVVLGAGSWGTALAILLTRGGKPATLWAHHPEQAASLQHTRRNTRYLPDAELPPALTVTDDLGTALDAADDILVAVPSHAFRAMLTDMARHLRPQHRVAWGTKGMEANSHKLLHVVAREVLGERYPTAVISGPTFAREVVAGLPTAITVASGDAGFARALADRLHDDAFRAYTTEDMVGVEVGGAVKNVLAIAAGIADGLGFGANTRAALITRGLAELSRMGAALGGRRETFMGLAGLGDLVLTCTDDQSRNRRFGLGIAQGHTPAQARATIGQVVEGERTASVVRELAAQQNVEMPISEQVYLVIYEGHSPRAAVHDLLNREQKPEML